MVTYASPTLLCSLWIFRFLRSRQSSKASSPAPRPPPRFRRKKKPLKKKKSSDSLTVSVTRAYSSFFPPGNMENASFSLLPAHCPLPFNFHPTMSRKLPPLKRPTITLLSSPVDTRSPSTPQFPLTLSSTLFFLKRFFSWLP